MTVYAVLREVDYEGSTLYAVFSTQARADAYAAERQANYYWGLPHYTGEPRPDESGTWVVEPMTVDAAP